MCVWLKLPMPDKYCKSIRFLVLFFAKKKQCTERKCMLIKKILKTILNVKNAVIDGMCQGFLDENFHP